jgi:CheY-like chemotaxis protein
MTPSPAKDVLIVDDDASIRNLICSTLTRDGLTCDTANDGVDAVDHLTSSRYAVMVLDLMLPRLDGAGVLREMRLLGLSDAERPIVFIVTASGDRDPLQAVSELVQVVIKKPFDLPDLRELVHDCVTARAPQTH